MNINELQKYKNLGRNSNISYYEKGINFIRVMFSDNSVYLYTNESAGSNNISQMILLADFGSGLNAFINKYVKKKYFRKER
jgi:hypothetical protein